MVVVVSALIAQVLIGEVLISPWWAPNLVLVGLVIAVGSSPQRWFRYACVTGLFTIAWSVRASWAILLVWCLFGWCVSRVSQRWDLTDRRVQCVVCGVGSLFLTFITLWFDDLFTFPLLGLAVVHAAMTSLSVPLSAIVARRLRGST